ncbi:MAG: MASE3 domain-containing protein [Thermodesulfobacteriota bacterium]
MRIKSLNFNRYLNLFGAILLFFGLYFTILHHYLLFRTLAELFSIVIAFGIFVVAWNSRHFHENNYLLFIGNTYLFVGAIDLVHTLSSQGMGIFQGSGTNLESQLWITGRFMESLSLLAAPFFIRKRLRINYIILAYIVITKLIFISIFYWKVFPTCFIEGTGLTPFKKISEYIISLVLFFSIFLLYKNKREFDKNVFKWVIGSIGLKITSEIFFALYTHEYGLSNLIGHYFKVLSFYFIYKAIIDTGISKPFHLLLRELKQKEEKLEIMVQKRTEELSKALKELEEESRVIQANNAILNLFTRKASRKEFLDDLVELIQEWVNCRCVGIRILDQQKFIPYESYKGFSEEFWKSESLLCLNSDQCICTRVIRGNLDPQEIPASTPYGSFYNNNIKEFIDHLPERERSRYRGVCLQRGFNSFAIIPIKYYDQVFGAIHLTDEREELVPLKTIEFLEAIAPLAGETIHRFNLESELNRNYEIQKAVNFLLQLSMEDIPLNEFLEGALRILVSSPWISAEAKGCLFLVEGCDTLVMKAIHGLSEFIQRRCSRVPFGLCLCGRAALNKKIHYTDSLEDLHDIHYEEIPRHSHYHAPILFGDRLLGIITLYLNEGERPSQEKEFFLNTIANTLAMIILRKEWEEVLKESENRLRHLSSQLLTVQEDERKEIARDLHDGVGQMLTAIKFKVEDVLQQKNQTGNISKEESLQSLIPIIKESIEELRRIQMNLRPSLLDDLGIIATLKWFTREFGKIYSTLQIVHDFQIEEEEIPSPLKIVIYRITQEAFNNIAKHSQADLVLLSLRKVDSRMELIIEDNGTGFDPNLSFSPETCKKGLGLNSMRERTELSGGTFILESNLRKGTIIKAIWPI